MAGRKIAAGAGRLDPAALALWETAARYLMYSGLAVVALGAVALHREEPVRGQGVAAVLILAGGLLFSATLAALALGGPRWLGAVTPLGGLAMILGFVLFGATAWRLR